MSHTHSHEHHDHAHAHGHAHGDTHDQAHDHSHPHEHGHHHHHGDEDPYYVDQLSQIAVTSAFGGICLLLYSVRAEMLDLILSSRFNIYVLTAGLILLAIAGVRAFCLWKESRAHGACAGDCGHDHHHHNHTLEIAHGQEMAVNHAVPLPEDRIENGAEQPVPTHSHSHGHAHHHHGHAHGPHDDHDHGWAPWRYVVLMVPIILFMLGLPNKAPSVSVPVGKVEVEELVDAKGSAQLVSLAPDPFSQITFVGYQQHDAKGTGDVIDIAFRRLFDANGNGPDGKMLQGKQVVLKGVCRKMPDNDKVAFVARFLRQCCSADAVQITIPVVSRQSLAAVQDGAWVVVHGKIDFQRDGRVRIVISSDKAIRVLARPDESYFIDG